MKIFKKSVAVVMAVIMVCTAMLAGISVMASGAATITVGTVAGEKGETAAVPLTITAADGVAVVKLDVTLAEGLTYVGYTASQDFPNVQIDEDDNVVSFIADTSGANDVTGTDVALITLNVAIDSETEAAELAITADGEACDIDENDVTVSFVDGKVTLSTVCQHEHTRIINAADATCDTDGYTGDTYCDDCHETIATGTVIPASGEHTIVVTDTVRAVNFAETGIELGETCGSCGNFVKTSEDTSDSAVAASATVRGFQAYGAINTTATGTVEIPFELPAGKEQANIHIAYIDSQNRIIGNALHSKAIEYNPVSLTSYSGNVATVDTDITGTIIVYTLADSTAIDTVLAGASMNGTFSAESQIELRFMLTKSKLKYNSNEIFTDYFATIKHDAYTYGDTTNAMHTVTTELSVDENASNSSYYYFCYGVEPAALSDDVDCYYYGLYNGVYYLLRTYADFSVVSFCTGSNGFAKDDAKLRTLLADILIYGDAAQKMFEYRTNNYISNIASVKDSMNAYHSVYANDLSNVDVVKAAANSGYKGSQKLIGVAPTLSCEARTEVRFVINFSTGFAGVYGTDAVKNVYYKFSVDGEMQDKVYTYDDVIAANPIAWNSSAKKLTVSCAVDSLQFGSQIIVYAYYDAYDGDAPATQFNTEFFNCTYSLNTYCKANYALTTADDSNGDIARKIYYYGASAEAYFL